MQFVAIFNIYAARNFDVGPPKMKVLKFLHEKILNIKIAADWRDTTPSPPPTLATPVVFNVYKYTYYTVSERVEGLGPLKSVVVNS